jgi:hypothetical protein
MKRAQWVRPGKKRNRAVRGEVDRDPDAPDTSVEDDRPRDTNDRADGDEVIWERGGGFSLLTDDDGVWERLT